MPPYSTISLHPPTHQPSTLNQNTTYDIILLGSGWASRVAAVRLVRAGLSALLIERELVGGDCPFWACMPSKGLLRPGEALREAFGVPGVRELVEGTGHDKAESWEARQLDVEAVFSWRDRITAGWDDEKGLVPSVTDVGVQVVRGSGRIVGVKKIAVEAVDGVVIALEARLAVIIGTGSEMAVPNVPGLRDMNFWGPRQATSSSEVPKRLTILGAGAVGCELATAYMNFGAEVELVSSSREILSKIDPEAGGIVRKSLEGKGVTVHLSAKPTKVEVENESDSLATVHLSTGAIITGTHVLVAAGRKPTSSDLGLKAVGLPDDGGFIAVNEDLTVKGIAGSWLYAGGDVNGRAPLTHMSKYHGRIISNAILARQRKDDTKSASGASGPASATADIGAAPQVIFTDPAVASVGLTRSAALKAGRKFREVVASAMTLGASLHVTNYGDSWAQWIIDEETSVLLGATFVGQNVAELLHASTVAIAGGITVDRLAHAIPCFPTMSEVYLNLLEAAGL